MELYEEPNEVHTSDMNSILSGTCFRMFLGLIASAITALYAYYSGLYIKMLENESFFILAIAEIVVVIIFSLLFRKLSPTAVTVLFFGYAFLNGFTLSVIFAVYELGSIAYTFIATSALFAVLAFIGYKTDKDLSNWNTILMTALIIGIVVSIINIFIGSSMLDIILYWIMLAIFAGLTIYDMNKIKEMQEQGFCDDEKLYVYGAMELYLDFINIFLRLFSIFGKRKD